MRRLAPATLLTLALAACSGGSSLGGLSHSDKNDKATASDKTVDPAADEDSDEDSASDKPVQVSGAFLTAVCGGAAPLATEAPPAADQAVFGCAVVDDKGVKTSKAVTIQSVRVRLASNDAVTPTPVAAPAGSAWSALFTLPKAQWDTAKRVVLAATVEGVAVTLTDSKPREHEGCGAGEVFNRSDRACLALVKLVRWYNPARADYILMLEGATLPAGWQVQAVDTTRDVYVAPPRPCAGGCALADDPRFLGIERHFGPPGTNIHVQCVEKSPDCGSAVAKDKMANEGVDFRGFTADAFPGLVRIRRYFNIGDSSHFYSATGADVPAGYADETGTGQLFHVFGTLP